MALQCCGPTPHRHARIALARFFNYCAERFGSVSIVLELISNLLKRRICRDQRFLLGHWSPFSQLPVAANRSRLVLLAYERAPHFFSPFSPASFLSPLVPCSSSPSSQAPGVAKARRRKTPRPKKPSSQNPLLMFVAVPWRRGNVSIQILPIARTRDMFDSYQTHLPQANRTLAFI